jgi:hypothetical protein
MAVQIFENILRIRKAKFCVATKKTTLASPASHTQNFYACIISGKPEEERKHHTQRPGGREKGGNRMVVV